MKLLFLALATIPALQQLSFSQSKPSEIDRDGYVEIIENKLDAWDGLVKKVRAGSYDDRTFNRAVSPTEAKALADELESIRRKVAKDLNSMKKASGSEWNECQKRIQARLDKMKSEFRTSYSE